MPTSPQTVRIPSSLQGPSQKHSSSEAGRAGARAHARASARPRSPRPLGAPPPGAWTSRERQPHNARRDARGRAPGARVSADPGSSGAPPPGAFGRRRSEASGVARSPRRRAAAPAALGRTGPRGRGARAGPRSLTHTLPFSSSVTRAECLPRRSVSLPDRAAALP